MLTNVADSDDSFPDPDLILNKKILHDFASFNTERISTKFVGEKM
jgi:hypothetical protein